MTELAKRHEGAAPARVPAGQGPSGGGVDALTLARNLDGLMALGRTLLKSGLLPDALRTPEAVVAVVIKGQELDVPPMHALSHIVMVKGKPTMSAELMRSLVLRAGHKIRVVEYTAERATVEGERRDDPGHATRISFDSEDVRTAGLGGQSGHRNYPKALKLARATSALCRAVFADAISGVSHTPEELGAEVDEDGRVVERAPVRGIGRRSRPRNPADGAEEPEEAEVVEDDTELDDVLREVGEAWEALPGEVRPDRAKVLDYARRDVPHARESLRRLGVLAEASEHDEAPDPDEIEGIERGGAVATRDGGAGGEAASREQVERLSELAAEIVADGDGAARLEETIGKPLDALSQDEAEEWIGRLRGERS